MALSGSGRFGPRRWYWLTGLALLFLSLSACAMLQERVSGSARLRETARLIEEVKRFGQTLGIEPTAALSQTAESAPALSLVWVWLQRAGTLAVRKPVDILLAVGFAIPKEALKLEQVYRVNGFSVYYRQGNEFADARAVATVGFADEGIVRRVKVILHEDLHGDENFDLPWDIEESIVTPLGSLAAVAFFEHEGDDVNLKRALASIAEERQYSRELNRLAGEAERIFQSRPTDLAKKEILTLIPSYPTYARQFKRQIAGQNPAAALEAKLSHDLAYYRHFDAITGLAEKAPDLRTLIADLKKLPRDASLQMLEDYLQELSVKYGATTQSRSPIRPNSAEISFIEMSR